jgi:hypothetical protein
MFMGFSNIFAGVVFIETSPWDAKYNPFYASAYACFGIVLIFLLRATGDLSLDDISARLIHRYFLLLN